MHVSPGVGLDLTTTAAQQLPQSLTGTQLKRAFETPVGPGTRRPTRSPPVRAELNRWEHVTFILSF